MKDIRFEKILKHCCDTAWEYNSDSGKIYVHYDVLYPNMVGKSYSPEEVRDIFFKKIFMSDYSVWEDNLSSSALENFLKSGKESSEFELRFIFKANEPSWYRVNIERIDEKSLMIFDRNIYDRIMGYSLEKNVQKVFDNILYIDTKTEDFIIHYYDSDITIPPNLSNYEDILNVFAKNFVIPKEQGNFLENMSLAKVKSELEKSNTYAVYTTLKTDDEKISYKKIIFSYLDSNKKTIVSVRLDITDLADDYNRQIKKYKKESYIDSVTGVYNRKYYEEKIKMLNIDAGVAVGDIDDFKLCNDTFGHTAGDEALFTIVEIINENMENGDTLIRFGGDEFLLIMPNISENAFEKKLKQIQKSVYETTVRNYPKMRLSLSIGGVILKDETVEEGEKRADMLMYKAKAKKNLVLTERQALKNERNGESLSETERNKPTVLIVDDSSMNCDMLTSMLQDDFKLITASNGEECIDVLNKYGFGISLVLLDIFMPVMDGFEVLAYMNKNNLLNDIPVIMISGADSESFIRRAYSMGASDYISRPFDEKVVYRRVYNIIKLFGKQRRLTSLAERQAREQEKNSRIVIDIFSRLMEFSSGESEMHFVRRVNIVTELLAEELMKKTDKYKLSWADCSLIETASSLHDVGKAYIDTDILNKPGKLTKEEFEKVKLHTVLGEQMLDGITAYKDEKLLKIAKEICRWHHERYDGSGYPDGLKGDEIPISAQLVSVADVYDALVSKRTYKDAYSHDEAVHMILNGECGSFNPLLLECFKEISKKIRSQLL